MKLIIKIITLSIIVLSFSFKTNKFSNNLIVDLDNEINDSINLQIPMLTSFYTLKSIDRLPLLKDEVQKYKGVPKCDSLCFYIKFEDPFQAYYDLYRDKKMNKNDFLEFIQKYRVDTLSLSQKKNKSRFCFFNSIQ